jgi:hypothetical protein
MSNPKGHPETLRPPWKKGAPSPNPGGRPKKLLRILDAVLDEKILHKKKRRTKAYKFVESVVDRATKRSDSLAKEIFERVDGPVPKSVELSGPGGMAIPVDLEQIDERVTELVQRARSRTAPPGGESRT